MQTDRYTFIQEARDSFVNLAPYGIIRTLTPSGIIRLEGRNISQVQQVIDAGLVRELRPVVGARGDVLGYQPVEEPMPPEPLDGGASPEGAVFEDVERAAAPEKPGEASGQSEAHAVRQR